MYYFFLDKILLPIPPESISIENGNSNKTYTLINEGEVNVIKTAPLQNIRFDFEIPSIQRPYAIYSSGFLSPSIYLEYLKLLKELKQPFQFIVTRQMPNGKLLNVTNLTVSLESYTVEENASYGFDFKVSIELKEYRMPESFLIKLIKVVTTGISLFSGGNKKVGVITKNREKKNKPKSRTHKVLLGDTLWSIARKYYGDGSKYAVISDANKIMNPNNLTIGSILTIPEI